MSEPIDFCKKRMSHLKKLMNENEIDVIYLARTGFIDNSYKRLTDTVSGVALVIPRDGDASLLTSSTDYEGIRAESWIRPEMIKNRERAYEDIARLAGEHLKTKKSRFGVNMSSLDCRSYEHFKTKLKGELVDITKTILPEVFFGLYPEEIRFQRTVCKLADIAEAAARESIAPGIREYEIAAEANYAMMRQGAESQSFPTIISSGERSALCHGWTGDREVMKGDLVVVDLGPQKYGYAADETRTFLVGKDEKKEKMLVAVNKAVEAALNNIKPGASCQELDAFSRKTLKELGFPDIPYGIGHALSGFVTPSLDPKSKDTLAPGMLFTVEPGIYLPSYGGVRIEEDVVVTSDGFELLTKHPRLI
jgi:Xaa-Pro aminopeptidase